jgi:pimeloyl-ACP methyl ester carboxylesterase
METLVEHELEVAGHRTRVLELAGTAPGIVLLHGWGDSADTWRPLLAALRERKRRAIAVDLPGFGRASSLQAGEMLPQLDAFVAELIAGWAGGGPVVVAGNSIGGSLALRLASSAPQLSLAGVVPVAPDGFELAGWGEEIERDPIVRALLDMPIPVPNALLRSSVGTEHHFTHPLLPGLATAPFDLAAVACPVLLVWGTRDRLVPHTGARLALGALPDTRVELIEGSGHHPHHDATGRLLELLLAFPGTM